MGAWGVAAHTAGPPAYASRWRGRRRCLSFTSSCVSSRRLGCGLRRTLPPSWCSRSSATRHAHLPAPSLAITTLPLPLTPTLTSTLPLALALTLYPLLCPRPLLRLRPLTCPPDRPSCSRQGCASSSPNSKISELSDSDPARGRSLTPGLQSR